MARRELRFLTSTRFPISPSRPSSDFDAPKTRPLDEKVEKLVIYMAVRERILPYHFDPIDDPNSSMSSFMKRARKSEGVQENVKAQLLRTKGQTDFEVAFRPALLRGVRDGVCEGYVV